MGRVFAMVFWCFAFGKEREKITKYFKLNIHKLIFIMCSVVRSAPFSFSFSWRETWYIDRPVEVWNICSLSPPPPLGVSQSSPLCDIGGVWVPLRSDWGWLDSRGQPAYALSTQTQIQVFDRNNLHFLTLLLNHESRIVRGSKLKDLLSCNTILSCWICCFPSNHSSLGKVASLTVSKTFLEFYFQR